jgi:hypothetical protein
MSRGPVKQLWCSAREGPSPALPQSVHAVMDHEGDRADADGQH